jgi:hypothetical protein
VFEGEAARLIDEDVRPVASGSSVWTQPEGRVRTAAGSRSQLVSSGGLRVTLGENTALDMNLHQAVPDEWIALESGSVRCEVPKLASGSRLRVKTPDAEVVVHGTVFSVQVRSAAGGTSQTCVRVEEGLVSVQHGDQSEKVGASQSWGCDDPKPPPAAASAAEGGAPVHPRAPRNVEVRPAATPVSSSEGLAEQNRLFQAALAAEARGDAAGALDSLRVLLDRYPQSPLGPDARTARSRIEARAHP